MRAMHLFRLFVLFFLLGALLFPQDTVLSKLNSLPLEQKIDKLSEICWNLRSSDPVSALKYGHLALALTNQTTKSSPVCTLLNYLGIAHGNMGNLDSSYFYYKKALELARHTADNNEIAYSLNNLGSYYSRNALYSTALENLLQAYSLFEQAGNKRGMAYALNDIGDVYYNLRDYHKAKSYFERSAGIRQTMNDLRGYARSLSSIASAQTKLNQLQNALDNYNKAREISEKIGYQRGLTYCYAGLSDIYLKQDRIEKALELRYKALEIDHKTSNRYGEIISFNALGSIYLKMKDYASAEKYITQAETNARTTGHLDQLVIAYKHKTNIFVGLDNYKSAYEYQKKYEDLREQIFGQESENKIADIQTAFVAEQKDRENAFLKQDIENQIASRNYLLFISLLVLGGALLFVSKYKLQKKSNVLLTQLNASKDKLFSIIAHDLKNPIGAVYNYADILNTDYDILSEEERKGFITKILSSSEKIKDLLLDLLTWSRSQKGDITVNRTELELKEVLYAIASSYRLVAEEKGIVIDVKVDDGIKVFADKSILQTIIGNLTNNALKFSHPNSKIELTGKISADVAFLSVKDFGVGMDDNVKNNLFNIDIKHSTLGTRKERGTGLGLKICKELAELHGGTLRVDSMQNEGSTFTFAFKSA